MRYRRWIPAMVIASHPVVRAQDSLDADATSYLSVKSSEVSPGALLPAAASAFKVPFCVEKASGEVDFWQRKLHFDKRELTLSDLLAVLGRDGCQVRSIQAAVLIRTPGVIAIKNNPLDTLVENFEFHGSHDGFVEKLHTKFPDLPAEVDESSVANTGNLRYDIVIKGPATIRDILLEMASRYGTAWAASVHATAPTIVAESPTLGRFEGVRSRVELSFQGHPGFRKLSK